jgi:hypothetical protein
MLKNGGQMVGGKGVRERFEGIEWTKVKHTHIGHTLRRPTESQLKY